MTVQGPSDVYKFSYAAGGVALPPADEAALLGGVLSVGADGFLSGTMFPVLTASAVGTATGTGGIVNIANVTGGAGDDSIVGSFGDNVLRGGAGNDTILGGPGNNLLAGDAGDDTIVANHGDTSDVIDGGAGTDTIQVNGGSGNAITVQPGVSGRLAISRTTADPRPFDIGGVETLTIGTSFANSVTVNNLAGVSDLTAVSVSGYLGSDTFTITPSPNVTVTVDGGPGPFSHVPYPTTYPDTLNVALGRHDGSVAHGESGRQLCVRELRRLYRLVHVRRPDARLLHTH